MTDIYLAIKDDKLFWLEKNIYNEDDSISVVKKINVDIIQNENINKITYRTMWLWKKYNVTGKKQKVNTFHPYIQKSRKIEKEDFLLVIC